MIVLQRIEFLEVEGRPRQLMRSGEVDGHSFHSAPEKEALPLPEAMNAAQWAGNLIMPT